MQIGKFVMAWLLPVSAFSSWSRLELATVGVARMSEAKSGIFMFASAPHIAGAHAGYFASLPDGQISEIACRGELSVQPLREKYSAFAVGQIISTNSPVSSHRGAARDRHGRGAGCGGR